ncbi:MaoC/PaaZ C-terminal domain-containing protein [Gulosibacter chungangensis]|uniref:MaoC-like domain-containing protein n=1 Tax=Gulosibacter chungangensis TaxID=979746 RepID=A0A7J5BHN0_9MICO|nr:MaoC/PaaZ C-terminal domain-containing protein [Gulosibacter chungangensis]KAB1645130.1 hypothetical protein F8O05_02420 [Gulosibacter chungangensis]
MTDTHQRAGAVVSTAAPAFEFAIEEGKANEFARATGAAGLVRDGDTWLAPPTFLTVSQLWMAPEHAAWYGITRNYGRVLHGEQRFDYPRGLPHVGDRFHARQAFGRSFEKDGSQGRMHFQEVVTRFWREDETDPDAIMTSLSITLPPVPEDSDAAQPAESGQASEAGNASESGKASGPSRASEPSDSATSAPLDSHTTEPLTLTDFVRYQGASGDFNPIHHDPEFARNGGYDGPFAVGMLTAGVAAARFGQVRDPRRLRTLRMRWQQPAWPGDRLTYTVTEETEGLKCVVTRAPSERDHAGEARQDTNREANHMTAWGTYA